MEELSYLRLQDDPNSGRRIPLAPLAAAEERRIFYRKRVFLGPVELGEYSHIVT